MEEEYATSAGFKIFYGALATAALFAGLFIYKAAINADDGSSEYRDHTGVFIVPVIGLIVAVLIVINLVKRKVITSDYAISYNSIWGFREIKNSDVKGFRVTKNAVVITSSEPGQRRIYIRDFGSLSHDSDLRKWLEGNLKNLDKIDFEESKDEILQNPALGATQSDREELFNKYRRYNIVYSLASLAFLLIVSIFRIFNIYISIIAFIYPLLGILLMANSKGLIRLYAAKNSAYAPIFLGLFFGAIILVVQSFVNVQIVNFGKLWEPLVIIAVIVCVVLFYLSVIKSKGSIQSQMFFVLLIGCIYAFGITLMINCTFDRSVAHIYSTKVENAYIQHGKSTTYTLVLGECEGFSGIKNVSVSSSYYYNKPVGSIANISVKKGTLGVPWFSIEKN